jgi:hypothetical protein
MMAREFVTEKGNWNKDLKEINEMAGTRMAWTRRTAVEEMRREGRGSGIC